MKYLKVFLIVLISLNLSAQGFRDKRFSFSYKPGFSMVGYLSSELVLSQKIELEYVLGKQFSASFNACLFQSKESKIYNAESFQIMDRAIGVKILYYRKKHSALAPLGFYMGFGLDVGSQNSWRYLDNPINENPEAILEYYDDVERSTLVLTSLYFGQNFSMAERVILGYGFQFGLGLTELDDQPVRHFGLPYINIGFIF